MREKLHKLSPMLECEARAESRGLCPKYPDWCDPILAELILICN